MPPAETNPQDRAALAFSALAWILSDDARASRFLALTGIEADDLRARVADPELHEAVFAFLEGHEPDLIECAVALMVKPEQLVRRPEPQL